MLKIERATDGNLVIFILSGQIEEEQVAELGALFDLGAHSHNLVLDLHEVRLVDREAVQFLARCEAQGARLAHCPAYIREWIARVRNQP
ncbi:MAG: hypothetical protein AB7G75_06340 [Candidatus Binatia bacterium]